MGQAYVSKTTSLLGVIFHPFGKTWYSLPLYKIWELYIASAMGPPKFTSIFANADGPRDAAPRKIDHIALPTEYNYHQATSVGW